MFVIKDYRESDGLVTIHHGDDVVYDCCYDEYTGDWLVGADGDDTVQGEWFVNCESAVQYALMKAGVINDAQYERAPARC